MKWTPRQTTSYKIDERIRRAVKDFCAFNGRETGRFVEEAIREKLRREWNLSRPPPAEHDENP